jgi:hypothetical protein
MPIDCDYDFCEALLRETVFFSGISGRAAGRTGRRL